MRGVSLWQQQWQRRWQGSDVQAFFRAWGRELLASLPAAVRRGVQPGRAPRPVAWPLAAGVGTPGERVVLELPAAFALTRRLALPLAAGRDLAQLMQFELDRFTPFTAEQVHYVVSQQAVEADQLWVSLALVRRDWLQECLAQCQARGWVVSGIQLLDDQGQATGVDLLPSAHQALASAQGRRLTWGLAGLCLALLVAVPLTWQYNRAQALATMQAEVQTLRAQAAEVATLRNHLDAAHGAAQFIARRRLAQPGRALLLSELTTCLPNDTWLQSLEIHADGQVDMAGLSARASALIGQLKSCNHLVDAQFQGVIQPDEASGRDRFYLRATARGEAGDAPPPDQP